MIEEKATSLIKAMKGDQGRTAEKELIEEAAWPEDELTIIDTKTGAGTAVALSAATV